MERYRIGYRMENFDRGIRRGDTHHVATLEAGDADAARAEFWRLFRSRAPLRNCIVEWVEWVDR